MDRKTLFKKLAIFAAPFILASAIELFILPIDFFTFRIWEAVTQLYHQSAKGPFYPNMIIHKAEGADRLGFWDPAPKEVVWYTDKYGFRNRPRNPEPEYYDIVLVGDSNIVGSYFDQKDTIAEVLARKCACNTYSYAVVTKPQFFSDPKFKVAPPRAVVVEARPGELYAGDVEDQFSVKPLPAYQDPYIPVALGVLYDRFMKANMLQFMRSRLGLGGGLPNSGPARILSLEERTEYTYQAVTAMRDELAHRGSDFIFFLMPTKDRSLDEAVRRLRADGVKVIAYLPTPEHPDGVDLKQYYQQHDSHWREESAAAVASLILELLTQPTSAGRRSQ